MEPVQRMAFAYKALTSSQWRQAYEPFGHWVRWHSLTYLVNHFGGTRRLTRSEVFASPFLQDGLDFREFARQTACIAQKMQRSAHHGKTGMACAVPLLLTLHGALRDLGYISH
eukprot:s419_g13.t1